MYREIELKYDVPLQVEESRLLERFVEVLTAEGFSSTPPRVVQRVYTYFDTKEWEVARKGETIRRVEGFAPGNSQGKFRYDYKTGALEYRFEENVWEDRVLTPSQILVKFNLAGTYRDLREVATVDTEHHKAVLTKGKMTLEAKVDFFSIRGGRKFKEMEVELDNETGGQYQHALEEIGQRVLQRKFGLRPISYQKYARVREMLGRR